MERIDLPELILRLPQVSTVEEVRNRVRCSRCRKRTHDIRIVYVGTDGKARGFHYRKHGPRQSPSSSEPSSVSPNPDTPT